jgi:hypothetical protein
MTTTASPRPDVPSPASARWLSEWFDWEDTSARAFRGTVRGEDKILVDICGFQTADGSVIHPSVTVKSGHHNEAPGSISAASARQLAADLLAAADELHRLNG